MSERWEAPPRGLVVAVLLLTLVVLGLGGAVLAVRLRPAGPPRTAVERDLAAWRQAVAAAPRDDQARTGLGLALLEAGRTAEARRAFEEALELNPENWVALFQLGLLEADRDPERAVRLLDRAAHFAPRSSKAGPLVAEGDLLMEMDDPEGARSAYRRAIADVPFLFDAHLGLARALEALGDPERALREYREAARFDPTDEEVREAIARLEAGGASPGP